MIAGSNDRALRAFLCSPACTMPRHLRHTALVLSELADWSTGRGSASQGRLAAAIGISDREVRHELSQLKAISGQPGAVRLETWSRTSLSSGQRTSNGYLIRPPITGAQETNDQSTGQRLPGSLSSFSLATDFRMSEKSSSPPDPGEVTLRHSRAGKEKERITSQLELLTHVLGYLPTADDVIRLAARDKKVRRIAARLLRVPQADLHWTDSQVRELERIIDGKK